MSHATNGRDQAGINLAVVRGRLSRPPEHRLLPSGDNLVSFEVTVTRPGARAETVPVVWLDAPTSALDIAADETVWAVGRVRRRFFRAGGATQSRTELVADRVLPARRAKAATRAVLDALRAAEEVAAG